MQFARKRFICNYSSIVQGAVDTYDREMNELLSVAYTKAKKTLNYPCGVVKAWDKKHIFLLVTFLVKLKKN